MSQEEYGVNEEVSQAPVESPAAEIEQESSVTEDVQKTESDGKDYKTIAENLSKALREERAKNKAPQTTPQSQPQNEDETYRRFLQTEANAEIAVMLQTDPSFKDRVELVKNYVEQGYDIKMADRLAKGDIMDQILHGESQSAPTNIPKQMQPNVTPEPRVVHQTGDVYQDLRQGNLKVELGDISQQELADIIKERFRIQD